MSRLSDESFKDFKERIKVRNIQTRTSGRDGSLLTADKYVSVVTLVQRTDALVRGLDVILDNFGHKDYIRAELPKELHAYLDTSGSEGNWLKRCKYLLAYPLAKYLGNEPPPLPDLDFKPARRDVRRWFSTYLSRPNNKNTQFWYSWFQSKRSTLPLSEDIIEETYNKHLATLTKVDEGDDTIINGIFADLTFREVITVVKRRMTKILGNLPSFEKMTPSRNACFEETRKNYGQAQELRAVCGLPVDRPGKVGINSTPGVEKEASDFFAFRDFHSIVWRPWAYTRNGIVSNLHINRTCESGLEDWSTLVERTQTYDLNRFLDCTIQAVLEPNKVRVISKGNAVPYYSCRPLQKALHGAMRSLAPFRLIGRPFCPMDMIGLCERASKTDKWFSVDYSAATDGLSWKYSGKILDELICDLPEHLRKRAESVLGPHNLHYPIGGGKIEYRGTQANGQLMGSILSFPILCLANLGVYLAATRTHQYFWGNEDRLNHVLINGDDMVYAAPEELWSKHVEIGRKVGLEMSVGKAYVHSSYANINSTSVICPLNRDDRTPRELKYLNSGLFFGVHKVQGNTASGEKREIRPLASAHLSADPTSGLVVNLNTLLAGSCPGREVHLLKRFLSEHKEEVRQECLAKTFRGERFTRNLFIPISLGGMGVVAPIGWKYKITKFDQYVANGHINQFPGCDYDAIRPLRGYELEKIDREVTVPWTVNEPEGRDQRFPKKEISFSRLRYLCRTGFLRFGPFKGSCFV